MASSAPDPWSPSDGTQATPSRATSPQLRSSLSEDKEERLRQLAVSSRFELLQFAVSAVAMASVALVAVAKFAKGDTPPGSDGAWALVSVLAGTFVTVFSHAAARLSDVVRTYGAARRILAKYGGDRRERE